MAPGERFEIASGGCVQLGPAFAGLVGEVTVSAAAHGGEGELSRQLPAASSRQMPDTS